MNLLGIDNIVLPIGLYDTVKTFNDWICNNISWILPIIYLILFVLIIMCFVLISIIYTKKNKRMDSFNLGECCVKKEIQEAIKGNQDYYLVNDVYFYNYGKGYHTQIDHVLITPKGVFAIETKYWKGTTYMIQTGIDERTEKSEIASLLYNGKLIININNGKANFYKSNKQSNIINQTIKHAKNLRDILFHNTNFVKGVLVFVENDDCKLNFDRIEEDYIDIMSLNTLIKIIQENKMDTMLKPKMSCIYPQKVYRELQKYSRENI